VLWSRWAPPWRSAVLIACCAALGKNGRYGSEWPSEPGTGGTKISGNRPRDSTAQWVTSDLATCGPVQDELA